MNSMLQRAVAFTAVFTAVTTLGFLIHAVILRDGYLEVAQLHRAAPLFSWLLLANAAFTAGALWLYDASRRTGNIWRDGVKYGLKLWVFWPVPVFLIAYSSQPIPGMLVAMQVALELVDMLLIGTLIAALYRQRSLAPRIRPA